MYPYTANLLTNYRIHYSNVTVISWVMLAVVSLFFQKLEFRGNRQVLLHICLSLDGQAELFGTCEVASTWWNQWRYAQANPNITVIKRNRKRVSNVISHADLMKGKGASLRVKKSVISDAHSEHPLLHIKWTEERFCLYVLL